MAKTLKIWNGVGWGRSDYDKNGNCLPTPIERYCEHVFVCAYSKAEAVRIFNAVGGDRISISEINNYWSDCWGDSMDGIEPEVGVWGQQSYNDKPVRLYPIEKRKY